MKSSPSKLKKYAAKRNFDITPEPSISKKKNIKKPIFVAQKHAASHLHYDLRLEIEGVLVSWAVPKGFTLNPAEKHLAVQTEDHPYAYAHFEGVIPAGEYGGGTVMVWDIGTYENIKKVGNKIISMAACLRQGRIEISLSGKKLRGGFALVRMARGDGRQWLLIKERDEFAKDGVKRWSQRSALTGRTMAQIKREES